MRRTKIKDILLSDEANYEVVVKGWVRSFRNNKFIALNDGSCIDNLQIVIDSEISSDITRKLTAGAAISTRGSIISSLGQGQKVELKSSTVEILGECDPEAYPLQLKNKPGLDYLRDIAHLRFRTITFGAIFRIRHSLAYAIHKFFNDLGFVYLHTPIITASDAEGAGEMFRVTTLDIENLPFRSKRLDNISEKYYDEIIEIIKKNDKEYLIGKINSTFHALETSFNFKKIVFADKILLKELSKKKSKFEKLNPWFKELYEIIQTDFFEKKLVKSKGGMKEKYCFPSWLVNSILPARKPDISDNPLVIQHFYPAKKDLAFLSLSFYNFKFIEKKLDTEVDKYVDFKEDFFGRATNLTVSGQLEAELGAMALSEVYTFGPTFRAENSNTTRHLAEFWMVEPEVAFNDLTDNMDLAEDFIKYIIKYALDNNKEDLKFLATRLAEEERQKPTNERSEMGLIEKLEFVLNNKFERITYTEAIDILLQSPHYKKKKFQYDVNWGIDMQSEHERYLVEKHFKKPVIVTNYPKEIKAFYMRQNDDGKTVAAMDILAPGIGEIVGGSQREERLDKLEQRMNEMHIPTEEMYWYLDTRRFGAVPHAGFGLGFERMVLFVTGMTNIRDVIPFPRTPKNAEF